MTDLFLFKALVNSDLLSCASLLGFALLFVMESLRDRTKSNHFPIGTIDRIIYNRTASKPPHILATQEVVVTVTCRVCKYHVRTCMYVVREICVYAEETMIVIKNIVVPSFKETSAAFECVYWASNRISDGWI